MMNSAVAVVYLVERQEAEGMTARAMAARLGIAEQTWCHVRKGRRPLPKRALMAACIAHPELRYRLFAELERTLAV